MARPTDEKKDCMLKVRMSEDLYSELVRDADKMNMSVSEYVRYIIKRRHKKMEGQRFLAEITLKKEL